MAGYILVPNLATLRAEFDARWPRRDRRSDGWIGDQAHASGVSGHNPDESGRAERQDADNRDEVRALDIDKDVDTAAGDELYAELDRIRRTPELRRRLIYIIYRRQIASASGGWVWRPYSGPNPHTEHGHVSGHPDYDDSTAPWGVAGEDDDVSAKDVWATEWQGVGRKYPASTWLINANKYAAEAKAEAIKARLTGEAVLAAVKGVDTRGIIARIDELATAERQRDADLAELVRAGQSGELAVDELLRRLGEVLTTGTAPAQG